MRIAVLALLALSACANKQASLPSERLQCHPVIRPLIDASPMGIDWQQVMTLNDARFAYDQYVDRIGAREWALQKYIRDLESKHKQCATNMQFVNNFLAGKR